MALVLSRLIDEIIMIGDNIEVQVVAIRGDKVRLGITAPGIAVHRKEIYDQIQRENAAAAALDTDEPLPSERTSKAVSGKEENSGAT